MGRVIHEEELEQMLQFVTGEVACHTSAASRDVSHTGAKWRDTECVVDRLDAGFSPGEGRAQRDVYLGRIS